LVSMSEVKTKRPFLSHRAKVIAALAVISIFVVLAFFLPPEGDSSNITGDSAVTPTVSITHLVATLTVNRGADLSSVRVTVTQVQEAAAFSNDRKHTGTYTVRVYIQALNGGQAPVGIDYPAQVRLLLPGGRAISPKYIAVAPVMLPNQKQDGFFDFPLSGQLDLSSLALRLDSNTIVTFGG
jgi:hypothetical protein